jgi:hypothetical protein
MILQNAAPYGKSEETNSTEVSTKVSEETLSAKSGSEADGERSSAAVD